jgi:NAD(P)-dependent dehydrogenase (short-subunit alcohol dehydrogenase family)
MTKKGFKVIHPSLSGQSIIVTGAASGIGKAAAILLAERGARVVLADLPGVGGDEVTSEIVAAGGQACFMPTDIARSADCEALVAKAVRTYGRLDGAFNNAATFSFGKRLAEEDEETCDRLLSVNIKGLFFCMKYEIHAMLKTGGGSIVNTSSIAGLVGEKMMAIYSATKHAVVGMTKTAALDYATLGIRINSVAPGGTRTGMFSAVQDTPGFMDMIKAIHPMGRAAEPAEVAAAAIFLLSPASSFMTGSTMVVDGGLTAQ